MNMPSINGRWRSAAILSLIALCAGGAAFPQARGHAAGGGQGPAAPHQHLDGHFGHNHYYFDRGYTVHQLPPRGFAVERGGEHYWYDGGHWYRWRRYGWIVDGAPFGAFVWYLPDFFTTVWLDGFPYYYANDTYYVWDGARQEYEVVEPPANIDTAGTTQPPLGDTLFVYPKNGQSAEQQARDRADCDHSAAEKSGYDRSQAQGGALSESAASKRWDYLRAEMACLEARGYSVK